MMAVSVKGRAQFVNEAISMRLNLHHQHLHLFKSSASFLTVEITFIPFSKPPIIAWAYVSSSLPSEFNEETIH